MATKLLELDLGEDVVTLQKLKNELKEIRKEFDNAQIGSEAFTKSQAEVTRLTAEIKKLNDTTKANVNALGGVNTSAKFADGSYGKLKQQIKETQNNLLKLNVADKSFEEEQKKLIQLQNERIAIEKKIPSLFQERIKLAVDESNSLKQLREDLKAAQAAALNGDGEAAKRVAELKDKIDDLKDSTQTLQGSGVERLNTSINLLTESFANFDSDKFKTAFEGIGSAMKAVPIFLLIEGVKLLIDNFEQITSFVQGFSDTSKEVKRLELEFEALNVQTNLNRNSLEKSIAIQEANIELLKSQNKSNAEIQQQEQELFNSKVQLIKVELQEAKASLLLNEAKLKQIKENDNLTESINSYTSSLLRSIGQEEAAAAIDKGIQQSKKERSKETTDALQDDIKKISELTTSLATLQIQNETRITTNAKEQYELRREYTNELNQLKIDNIKNEYQRAIEQSKFNEKQDLFELNRAKISAELKEQTKIEIQKKYDLERYNLYNEQIKLRVEQLKSEADAEIENAKILADIDRRNRKAIAEQEIIDNKFNLEAQFAAKLEILNTQKEAELAQENLTREERLAIQKKYDQEEINLEREKVAAKQKIRQEEITFAQSAAQSLVSIAQLLNNNQDQQASLAKTFALINIAANTAKAISDLTATVFSPLSPDNLATGGIAAYAKLGVGIATILGNAVQAKNILNSFEEGGYTGDGNPHEVSTNLGTKDYTYHKGEYVTPNRVLNTPKGAALVGQLEALRKGISNPAPWIGGKFDGGFTARSASVNTETNFSNTKMITEFISKLPPQYLRVTDLNKVTDSNSKAVSVSSL